AVDAAPLGPPSGRYRADHPDRSRAQPWGALAMVTGLDEDPDDAGRREQRIGIPARPIRWPRDEGALAIRRRSRLAATGSLTAEEPQTALDDRVRGRSSRDRHRSGVQSKHAFLRLRTPVHALP